MLLIPLGLLGQSKLDYEIGGGVYYQMNFHNGSFTKLNEIPNCCPEFGTGDGSGFAALLFYKMPLFDKLSGQIRVGYSMFDANFLYKEATKVSVDDQAVDGEFQHTLNADFTGLLIQPIITYEIIPRLNFNIGLDVGYLLSASYYQIEEITKPTDRGTYIDNGVVTDLRKWNEAEGDIPKLISLQFGGLAGLSYDFPLNHANTLWLSPEVYYTMGFTDVAENTPWKISSLFVGVNVKYRPNPKLIDTKAPIDEKIIDGQILAREIELSGNLNDIYWGEFKIPDIEDEKQKVKLISTIKAVGVDEGVENDKATMVVEEFLSTNMRPLLNYVFFDENKSDLPDRYELLDEKEADKFSNANLCNITTIRTYYDILNVFGMRLRENPNAKLSLTGCNNGRESGGTGLSQKRADNIKSYLTNIWKISNDRITTKASGLPAVPSNQSDKDGIEENRRAEITCDSWEVMKPIVTEDTLRKVSPPIIRFYMSSESDNEIKSWKLTAMQNGDVLKVVEGDGKLPDKFDWLIDREKESIPQFSEPIEYMVELTDKQGNTSVSQTGLLPTDLITIQKKKDNRVGDKRIDKYSLILFDYNSTELSKENTNIIQFIKGNLKSDSRILISGFTDRMGNEDFNFKLSKDRAEKTALALERPNAFTRGVGESMLIYDNTLPEGRFYCRTVEVEVETPMSWNK
jgi:outer membrane protein OmpA-like peptidoglycan-associated protein